MLLDTLRRSPTRLRIGLALAAALVASFGVAKLAQAQPAYPTKPIRLVVGFAAGGPSDILARIAAASMTKTLGQQVYVENRTGASGNLATELVARAEPDGYTLLLTTFSHAVNETLFKNFKYKAADHFTPIACLVDTGLVLLVHPSLDVKSVKDLVAYAKSKPGDVLYATAGKGTATHVAAALFEAATGIKMVPVHYKGGGETIKDLLSGQVKVMFSTIPPVLGFVHDGKLRGLATTGLHRDKVLPNLPTIAESGVPGYEVVLWSGISAPKGTPQPIIDKLDAAAKKVLEDPVAKKALDIQGYTDRYLGSADFKKFYDDEASKWAKVTPNIGTLGE